MYISTYPSVLSALIEVKERLRIYLNDEAIARMHGDGLNLAIAEVDQMIGELSAEAITVPLEESAQTETVISRSTLIPEVLPPEQLRRGLGEWQQSFEGFLEEHAPLLQALAEQFQRLLRVCIDFAQG